MVLFESVKRDGYGTKSCGDQFVETLFGKCQTVCDHSPRIAARFEGSPYVRQVFAHERFTAGDDDQHFMRIHVRRDFRIYDMQKILRRHVGCFDGRDTVASTVEAVDVTAECRFPEELAKWV